jgi:hypothetical protein
MGHDTTAYLGRQIPLEPHMAASADELGAEIASLRGNYGQYEALGAEMYDGRVSGGGIGRWFTRNQLEQGLERLRVKQQTLEPAVRTCRPAIEFFETCLSHLSPDQEWVYIDFG